MMQRPGGGSPLRLRERRRRPSGQPTRFGTSGAFTAGLGRHIEPHSPHGYYIDLSSKADSPDWPPAWYTPDGKRLYVGIIQWGLGCHERYMDGDGEDWLDAALKLGDHLLELQERDGRHRGGWIQRAPYEHTYHLRPPWLSGMAQGEGASLLVRLYCATGDARYADGAHRALEPMRRPASRGGVAGDLDGGFFPEEYPTDPPAHVLNGGIFGLWGCYDVAVALDAAVARELATEGIATLAGALVHFDTGWWSRYDLFPHPVINVASPMYHRLHTDQLRAMTKIDSDPSFSEAIERFERYASSSLNVTRAFARKVLFRLAVPRSRVLAHLLPWARSPSR